MKCFRCQKTIDKKDRYYSFNEYSKGIKVKTDYAHKECWDNFMKNLDGATNSLQKSNYLLDALGKQMDKVGMINKKEEVIYNVE